MIANLLIGDLVAKLCLTFVTPWNVAHQATFCGILQTGILEWVAMPSSRGSSQPREQALISCIAGRFFTHGATWEALSMGCVCRRGGVDLNICEVQRSKDCL